MNEEEIAYLLFEREPFLGYEDALRAIEIYEEAAHIYQAALTAMCPVKIYTTDNTAGTAR